MDERDTRVATSHDVRVARRSFDPSSSPEHPGGRQLESNDHWAATTRSQEYAQDGAHHEYLAGRSSGVSSPWGSSPVFPLPEEATAGHALSHMMALNAARAPIATQDELHARLRHFSQNRVWLLRDAFFYTEAEVIELISQAMEDRMTDHAQAGEFYVGVQRLSRVADRLPRFGALLQRVRRGYLYGLNDLEGASERIGFSHPRLMTVVLHQDRRTGLEWFWFVVVDTPTLQTALVAQQVEGDLWSDAPQNRMYKGFWTFDPDRVQRVMHILRQAARLL